MLCCQPVETQGRNDWDNRSTLISRLLFGRSHRLVDSRSARCDLVWQSEGLAWGRLSLSSIDGWPLSSLYGWPLSSLLFNPANSRPTEGPHIAHRHIGATQLLMFEISGPHIGSGRDGPFLK